MLQRCKIEQLAGSNLSPEKVNQSKSLHVAAGMKRSKVVVLWREGLHLRPAAMLVQVAKQFQSAIYLKCGGKIADLRSILSVLALCATMGTGLDVEAAGDDEQDAIQAIEQVFSFHGNDANSAKHPGKT
jgi:phosphotransferase system HPr (HPr) family protein